MGGGIWDVSLNSLVEVDTKEGWVSGKVGNMRHKIASV